MKLSDIPKFRVKGRENVGANCGASFGVHGGAIEGRSQDLQSILYLKKCDFCNRSLDRGSMNSAPPCAPP